MLKVLQTQKALLNEGITLFNTKPSKGITFLQDKGILKTPTEVDQVAAFLRASPKLDKAMYAADNGCFADCCCTVQADRASSRIY